MHLHHRCPVSTCSVQLPENLSLCLTHWNALPVDVQKRLKLYRRDSPAWVTALNEAILLITGPRPSSLTHY